MTAAIIHMAGERLLLDPAGGLYWPGRGVLVVSDLHLEKGSAAAARGSLLPPWDTRATLDVLAGLLRRYSPKIVVALGDSFHDSGGSGRLLRADRVRLHAMAEGTEFVWVLGNHDPSPPEGVAGSWVQEWEAGPFMFRHIAQRAGGEFCGHLHPKASVPVRGTVVTRSCFVTDGQRMMLPALGAYTGGLDVGDPAVGKLFPKGGRVFLLGRERLFSFALAGARKRGVADVLG